MLLEQLRTYAMTQMEEVPPPGYQRLAVRYILRLQPDGTPLLPVIDTADASNRSRGKSELVPHVKRASGIAPKLLADTGEYVLGIARNDPKKPTKPERLAAQREAFVALVNDCAVTTGEPAVQAVAAFLAGEMPTEAELGTGFDASATITFRVNDPDVPEGILPVELPRVRAFWAARQAPDDEAATGNDMACIVCGTVGPVLERHPLKIKGIPGGQIQKDLISANATAFESYGLKASQIAPTCQSCAEAYGNALNALLGSETNRLWTKELAFAFWTEAKPDVDDFGPVVIGLVTDPDAHPTEVKSLLHAYWTGKQEATAIDPARFYAAAFGASGARVVVKDWIDTTVGDAKQRLARYFALQEMIQWDGSPSVALPMYRLTSATVHKGAKNASAPPIVTQSLIRLAVAGDPLPLDLLFLAVRRNRAEQEVTRERAMLIKMVMGSHMDDNEEIRKMTELEGGNADPAYLCGRLLATLDRIQYAALREVNASIVDKFYGTASSAPATVFGTLLHGAQNHLGKLDGRRRNSLNIKLEEILVQLDDFPSTLSLREQGLFALGFYHQRADDRKQAAEAKARRESSGQLSLDAAIADDVSDE